MGYDEWPPLDLEPRWRSVEIVIAVAATVVTVLFWWPLFVYSWHYWVGQ